MKCLILKPFWFAKDGVFLEEAKPGPDPVEVPDHLVPGLVKERFISTADKENKSVPWAPENKAIASAPEQQVIQTAPEDKVEETESAEPIYEAKETGAGWFAIFKDGVELDGLKKFRADEAGKFNAMSSQEKAEHVAEELAKD